MACCRPGITKDFMAYLFFPIENESRLLFISPLGDLRIPEGIDRRNIAGRGLSRHYARDRGFLRNRVAWRILSYKPKLVPVIQPELEHP